MLIRQEESSPIGDYFHDNGFIKTFEKIQEQVDEFEIDTDILKIYCEELGNKLKSFKSFITTQEKETLKKAVQKEIADFNKD